MSNLIDTRSKLLLSEDFDLIKHFKIAVIGLGGVGSIIPMSLIRSGVKNLLIIDGDKVDETNLNRQMAYFSKDVGKYKSEVLKERLFEIRDDIEIEALNCFVDENFDFSIFKGLDYIIDCIDDIDAKVLLAKYALNNNVSLISSMGTGNRLDPAKLSIVHLDKTSGDPLAKKFRYLLRKENIDLKKINVVSSSEEPIVKGKVVSSMAFVPNSSGLLMSSFVLKELLRRYKNEVR